MKSALMGASALFPVHKVFGSISEGNFATVRRNVGTFVAKGGTIGWLVNKEAVVIIDAQFPDTAAECVAGLEERTDLNFDMLINTHHHGDHTGGNPVFQPKVKHIVAHENVPGLMKNASDKSDDELALPDTVYKKSWKKDVGDETVHLNYYGPAHTGGDSVVYFEKARVAHMGDLMFNRAHPYIDRPAGASISNWIQVLENTANDLPADTKYIFGHGSSEFGITGTRDDLAVMKAFLEALLNFTQKGIDAGKPKEELIKKEALEGFEAFNAPGWRLPLSANIEVAYAELTERDG